jgi:transcriptional regulator with XRE-family HTH domain/tetratricopeptide (TPR) repeat protein
VSFGAWLRRRRIDLQITQETLADRCGIAVRTLRYIEAGRTSSPRADTRRAIVTALDHLERDLEIGRGPDPAHGVTPAQLPPDLATFVGRHGQLKELDRIRQAETPAAAATCLIIGAAGMGKTALAVHWGHQVRAAFPDGQLYADLRGFGPSAPARPMDVLRGFLDALGVPAERIPTNADEQVAVYRTTLAGRRVLIVLDNARGAEQVRPLLPGAPGSMAVVTSRNQLSGLVAVNGAHPLPVDACTLGEGRDILTARLGAVRVNADPAATAEIVRLCAGLPLALAVVGARAAVHPDFPLEALAAELSDVRNRLTALDGGDPAGDVRSAMSWSYAALSERAARMFRILGLHPLPELPVGPAASMLGWSRPEARNVLGELARAHLVIERSPGRFAVHDVIHAYAADLSDQFDDERTRRAAVSRLHEHYAYSANRAARALCANHPEPAEPPQPGVHPDGVSGQHDAVAWFAQEHPVLLAVLHAAARFGSPATTWHLGTALFKFLDRQGRWRVLVDVANLALTAAERIGDPRRRSESLRILARGNSRIGDDRAAARHLLCAERLAWECGDAAARADVLFDIALMHDARERYVESVDYSGRALAVYREAGHRVGEASALNAIAWGRLHLGEPEVAVRHCEQALVLYRAAANRYGEAATLDTYGLASHRLGRFETAIGAYRHALALVLTTGDRHLETAILERLAAAQEAYGHVDDARRARRRALSLRDTMDPVTT